MSILQNSTESTGGSSIESEAGSSTENSGWQIEDSGWDSDSDGYYYNDDPHVNSLLHSKALIRSANKNINLYSMISSFGVSFEEVYSPSGWTHKCSCPLPGHKDKTPSFGLNPIENRFYCFGCQSGGGPVQFYALMKRKSNIEAAEFLLRNNSLLNDVVEDIQNSEDEEIDRALLSFSDAASFLLKSNPHAMAFIEKLSWSLDLYLQKHIPRQTLDAENLTARVGLLIKKIEEYDK